LAVGGVLALALLCARAGAQDEYEWRDGQWVRLQPPEPDTPAGQVALIRQDVEAGRPRRALKAAEKFLEDHPDAPQREEVFALAGQAEMNRGRWLQAYEWFERQLTEYPNGALYERALEREYDIAERFLAGEKQIVLGFLPVPAEKEGLEILTGIAEHAPGSAVAERALMRVARHHHDQRDYADAVDAYDRYVQMFGKAPRAPEAMLQAARALLESFGGAEFDETPLLEADQRLRAFAAAYPVEAGQADVDAMLEQVADLRAEKLYTDARFYERVGRPAAAVFYYRRLRETFSQTAWASRAEEDLARLGEGGERRAETDRAGVLDLLNQLFRGQEPAEPRPAAATAPAGEEGGSKP